MSNKCTCRVNHKKIKVEDGNRKAIFKNDVQEPYDKIIVDACLINNGPRADFLVNKVGKASAIVELKGKNVEHALEQIFATASHADVAPLLQGKLGFLVISRQVPRFNDFIRKAKETAAKKFKAGCHFRSGQREVDIEEVVKINGNP